MFVATVCIRVVGCADVVRALGDRFKECLEGV